MLEEVLTYQIVPESFTVDDLPDGEIDTEQGEALTIEGSGDAATVNGAAIVSPDIEASNGVIQGIDEVLVPESISLDVPETATDNIVQLLAGQPQYSTLSALLAQSGFETVLADTGPFTLFAPDNAAFDALPGDEMGYLQSDDALLRQVLAYHGVIGRFPTDELEPGELNTAEGQPVTIAVEGDTVDVNSAPIVQPDQDATNGIVQGIDQVLVPPGVSLTPPATAPTTTAPPAATTTTGPAATSTTESEATTTTSEASTTTAPPDTAPPVTDNLYDVLASDPHFDLFVELIDAAGLEETLADADEITVFAPTDGAFGGDPEEAADRVDRIIDEVPEDDLVDLLLYQAVPDLYPIDSLEPGDLETFLDGETITVLGSGDRAEIQGAANPDPASILAADLQASNGLAHGILEFLLPSGIEVPD